MSWHCRVGLHVWSAWSAPKSVTYEVTTQRLMGVVTPVAQPYEYTRREQERVCTICGLGQERGL